MVRISNRNFFRDHTLDRKSIDYDFLVIGFEPNRFENLKCVSKIDRKSKFIVSILLGSKQGRILTNLGFDSDRKFNRFQSLFWNQWIQPMKVNRKLIKFKFIHLFKLNLQNLTFQPLLWISDGEDRRKKLWNKRKKLIRLQQDYLGSNRIDWF